MGGTEGHPKERPGELKRGGHPGHTDKTREGGCVEEEEGAGQKRREKERTCDTGLVSI